GSGRNGRWSVPGRSARPCSARCSPCTAHAVLSCALPVLVLISVTPLWADNSVTSRCGPFRCLRGGDGALPPTVAAAQQREHVGAVEQAIQQTLRQHLVGEERVQILGVTIG